mmetsp:Transcript_7010/g.9688  ORF Transcript_7010/g.9688 Transcript_7010/m.9688 type:complete len:111 (-) Transcript_7010:124-456(-)
MAAAFQEEYKFPGNIYVDQKRQMYDALGCNRGAKFIMSLAALKAARQAYAEGFTQGATQGDALQLGGVFVISRKEGILYQYLEQFAGDHAKNEELLKACSEIGNEQNNNN